MALPRATPVHHSTRNCHAQKTNAQREVSMPQHPGARGGCTYTEQDECDHDVAEQLRMSTSKCQSRSALLQRGGGGKGGGGHTRLFQLAGLASSLNLSTTVALCTPTRPVLVGGPLGSSQIVSPICVPAPPSTTQLISRYAHYRQQRGLKLTIGCAEHKEEVPQDPL